MKYVYVDTDGSTTPTNATPDNSSNSKWFTTDVGWAGTTDGSRWNTLHAAANDVDIAAINSDGITIYCRGVTADSRASLSALTCTSLTIIGEVTEAKWNANKYRIINTNLSYEYAISYGGPNMAGNFTIRGLQCECNSTHGGPYVLQIGARSGTTNTIDSCIIRTGSTSRTNDINVIGLYLGYNPAACTWNVYNTIIYALGGSLSTGGVSGIRINGDVGITANIYNCVIADIAYSSGSCGGIRAEAGDTVTVKNCAVFDTDAGTDFINVDTESYNATDDAYGGTGDLNGRTWTSEFEDWTNGDFRLKSGATLIGAGLDDPGSGAFSDDIVGTTRSDWDIGAFEYVFGGTSTPYVQLTSQRLVRHSGRYR